MIPFLSPEWLVELDRALSALRPDASLDLRVDQVVRTPGGETSYSVWVSGGRAGAGPVGPQAQATVSTDLDTAAALAQGALSAPDALGAGRVRLRGQVPVLLGLAEALGEAEDALGDLRRRTAF